MGYRDVKVVAFLDYIVFFVVVVVFLFWGGLIADLSSAVHQLSSSEFWLFSPAALISSPAVMMNKIRAKDKTN